MRSLFYHFFNGDYFQLVAPLTIHALADLQENLIHIGIRVFILFFKSRKIKFRV